VSGPLSIDRAAWLGGGFAVIAALLPRAVIGDAPSSAQIIQAAPPSAWRSLAPENTLYMQLPAGRVIIELAPAFAPLHVANIRTLVQENYFDGLAVLRAQDNYVVQWGDPDDKKSLGGAKATLEAEFTVSETPEMRFTPLPDRDGYAPQSGFAAGLPAARNHAKHRAWLANCYGMVGVGRDNDPQSGNGSSLFVVIGQAPRQLDRNITLVGRVWFGMELLSTLHRGSGPLGFYETSEERTNLLSVRMAADVPEAERTPLQVMRTDSPSFAQFVAARRNRREDWFKVPAGFIDVCNVPIPTRALPAPSVPDQAR
jgi:cyclophilin family peptidyl-prolyl cis-trans isomerase